LSSALPPELAGCRRALHNGAPVTQRTRNDRMTSPDLSALTADADGRRISAEIAQASGTDPFSSTVRAKRMPMVISDPRQADNPIVFANDAFCRLTGYSREEIVGRNCRFLQGAGTDPAAVVRIGQAVRADRDGL